MTASLPSYYSRLKPFRHLFAGGVPILTYHKFGRPPRGARLRGLHLPPRLLQKQIRELHNDDYRTGAPAEASRDDGNRDVVVLTIDDGFRSVLELALPVLERAGAMATLYLVAGRLGGENDWEIAQGELAERLMSVEEVKEWVAAGQRIGSHTLTHPWLTRVPVESAREEIRASRQRLEDTFGVEVTDFCYPYGDWNVVVRDEVEAAGYRTATTTDFGVNKPGADPLALRRVTARRPSWGWRAIRQWWRRRG